MRINDTPPHETPAIAVAAFADPAAAQRLQPDTRPVSIPLWLKHFAFCALYFLYGYGTDVYLERTLGFGIELLLFCTENVYLFYAFLVCFRKHKAEAPYGWPKTIARFGLAMGFFLVMRHVLRYLILAVYVDAEYGTAIKPLPLVAQGSLWIINYIIFAMAYFKMTTGIEKQKLLNIAIREKAEAKQQQLVLENNILRNQINPHFLYNTLSMFHEMATSASPKLPGAVATLARMLRYSLEGHGNAETVLLSKEIAHIRNMADLARLRFGGDNFHFELEEEGPLQDVRIVPFTLITLVENIFKHGDLKVPELPARVSISLKNDTFSFKTWNRKGSSFNKDSTGLGLRNSQARLKFIHGDDMDFQVYDSQNTFETHLLIRNISKSTNLKTAPVYDQLHNS